MEVKVYKTGPVVSSRFGIENSHTLEVYEKNGGYRALKKALKMSPDDVIEEVKKSGLRGRGGAGFPTGIKWTFMPKERNPERPSFLCINCDEGEPGTFKDRYLVRWDPHQLVEGAIIATYALRAPWCIVYVRAEMWEEKEILKQAIAEAKAKGYLGEHILGSEHSLHMCVATGAGAYICGEETAMLNSIEGRRGEPRMKPPFPAASGAFGMPTTVNNVESISSVPYIINEGGETYASLGCERNGGTRLFSVSGHVVRRGLYELPMGTNLNELVFEHCGGLIDGMELQAVIPGGSSCPPLLPEECDISLDYDSLAKANSMLGSGGTIVIGDRSCMVKVFENLTHFYSHESCGQCTPCREGTEVVHKFVQRIEAGEGREGDLETLYEIGGNMMGTTICVLADSVGWPIRQYIDKFRDDWEAHIREGRCPKGGAL